VIKIKKKIVLGLFIFFVLLHKNVFASTNTSDVLSGLGVNINGYFAFVLQGSPRRNIAKVAMSSTGCSMELF
jgi:hypothetical protein